MHELQIKSPSGSDMVYLCQNLLITTKEAIGRVHYETQLEQNSTLHNKTILQNTLLREDCLLRQPSHKSGRDIHPNGYTNLSIEPIRIMKTQGSMKLPKAYNSIVTDSKAITVDKMSDK